jgi:hypothetical protein
VCIGKIENITKYVINKDLFFKVRSFAGSTITRGLSTFSNTSIRAFFNSGANFSTFVGTSDLSVKISPSIVNFQYLANRKMRILRLENKKRSVGSYPTIRSFLHK